MSVNAGEIFPALEALEVARFKTNPVGEVLGFSGLGTELQPTIVVSPNAPVNDDGRPDGTIWIQVTP
jgi:hypothetical protein